MSRVSWDNHSSYAVVWGVERKKDLIEKWLEMCVKICIGLYIQMGFTWKVLVWFKGKAEILIDSYFYKKAENPSLTDALLTLIIEGLVTSKAKLNSHKYIPSGEWKWLHYQSPYFRKWDDDVFNRYENTLKESCIFLDSFPHKSLSYHKLSRSCMLNHCFLNLPENETVNPGTSNYKPFFWNEYFEVSVYLAFHI